MTLPAFRGVRATLQAWGRPVVSLLGLQFVSGAVVLPRLSFFPIYLEEGLGYAPLLVSTFAVLGQLLGMVAALVGGSLCDLLGRKWTLVLGLAGLGLGSLAFSTHSPSLVMALWGLAGFGLGLRTPATQSYLIDAAQGRRLGLLSAAVNVCFIVGAAVGSPAGGAILDARGFGTFGVALAGLSMVTATAGAAALPTVAQPRHGVSAPRQGASLGYGRVLRREGVPTVGLLRFLPTCYYGMATVLIPLLMNRVADSKMTIALYGTASQVFAAGSQLLVGWASDRWGPGRPTVSSLALLVAAAGGLASSAGSLWGLFLFGILGNCAAWALSTLVPCLVSRVAPATEHGRVLGLVHLVWNIGMMTGSVLGGALVEVTLWLPFVVTATLNGLAIALAAEFFRRLASRDSILASA